MSTKSRHAFLFLRMHSLIIRQYVGIASAYDSILCGLTPEEGFKHIKYQIYIHKVAIQALKHKLMQEYINNYPKSKPLPLP